MSTPSKAPAKRSQHVNATYRNIVGRNMLLAFGHLVATCCVLLAQTWPVSNLSQQHPTYCNTSQHGGQTHATCCAQQCWDMLCWHVAIVWPGLKKQTNIKKKVQMVLLRHSAFIGLEGFYIIESAEILHDYHNVPLKNASSMITATHSQKFRTARAQ